MLGNAANFISSQMSNGTGDPDLVRSIGTSLFSGIGNVLSAASSKAGPNNEEADEDKEADELKTDSETTKEKVIIRLFQTANRQNVQSERANITGTSCSLVLQSPFGFVTQRSPGASVA